MKHVAIALIAGAALVTARPVLAEQVVFVVRHAERASSSPSGTMMAEDPPLSQAGEQRAARLAALLAAADIRQIFTTEFRRTRQTADPLGKRVNIAPVSIPAKEPDALVQQVRGVNGNVLIVGHSNTLPDLLKRLGVPEAVSIRDDEYDNVFLVIRNSTGPATLVRLKY